MLFEDENVEAQQSSSELRKAPRLSVAECLDDGFAGNLAVQMGGTGLEPATSSV